MHRRLIVLLLACATALLAPGCYYSGYYVSDNFALSVNSGYLFNGRVINDGSTVFAVVNELVTIDADVFVSGDVAVVSAQWVVLSGPAAPFFTNQFAQTTSVLFPTPGQYILVFRVVALVNGVQTVTDSNPVTVVISQFIG